MYSSFGIKSILLAIAVVLIASFMYYQQKKLEGLILDNANLQLQLNVAVEANKDLNSSLCKITKYYEDNLVLLESVQTEKSKLKKDIDMLKRKVLAYDEANSTISTANDILNRLQ